MNHGDPNFSALPGKFPAGGPDLANLEGAVAILEAKRAAALAWMGKRWLLAEPVKRRCTSY